MRTLVGLSILLASTAALAGPEVQLDAAYDAGAGATDDTAGDAQVSAAAGADVAAALRLFRGAYEVEAGAGATVDRLEGTVDATGAATRAHLYVGPAAPPEGPQSGMNGAFVPIELDHAGELSALPHLSDRPDVARGLYDWEEVGLGSAFLRVRTYDAEPGKEGSFAVDAMPVHVDVRRTSQDLSRLETSSRVALMSFAAELPQADGATGTVDCLAVETRHTQLSDGSSAHTDVVWMIRAEIENPYTGSTYTIGFGEAIADRVDPGARPPTIDHKPEHPKIGSLGLMNGSARGGYGAQYERTAYITMAAEPAIDDRFWVEGWGRVAGLQLSGKGFVARTQRLTADGWRKDWTGGVELDAGRDVGPVALGLHAEAGRSFYADLDGTDPSPDFGARGALTVRRARGHRWFYR